MNYTKRKPTVNRIMVVLALVIAMLSFTAVAEAGKTGSSSSSSKSSSSSSSSKSSSSSSSSKSSSSGYKSSTGKSYNKASVAKARPSIKKPSSGKKQQPTTAAHLIPDRFNTKVPAGRSYDVDRRTVLSRPYYLDPYSPYYYGNPSSIYFYLWLAEVNDDDDDRPLEPQKCHDYDKELNVCLDEVDQESSGGGCNSFVLWPWLLGGGGLMALRRRLRTERV
jgi:hypothetical protein